MRKLAKTSVLALVAACSLAIVPSSGALVGVTFAFPSNDSTVVASVGFIDSDEVGYFWSAVRGDRVTETFTGPPVLRRAVLSVEVVTNVLAPGAHVDWRIEINGNPVGTFVVNSGFTGPIVRDIVIGGMVGPIYTVTIRVTNTVAPGLGSHTLAYAGPFAHSIELNGPAEPSCSDPRLGMPCRVGDGP
jgi:hypothetical protein